MKKILFALFSLFVSNSAWSQWTVANFNTATDVSKIKFYSTNQVWLACDTGVFLSINNGNSFTQNGLYYPGGNIYIGSYLNDVAVVNASTAIGAGLFYLGNDELIIRSINSGANWDTVEHFPNTFLAQFHCTDFPTASTGYIAGWQGRIFRSVNGGVSWGTVYTNPAITWYDCEFVSANKGVVVGEGGIVYTSNGTTFNQVLTVAGSTFNSVSFSGSTGYAGGTSPGGNLYKSTDNGATWTIANFPYDEIKSLFTLSADTVVAVTLTSAYKTTNAGVYWEEFVLPALPIGTHQFKDIAFRGNEGYIACSDGVLLKTANGGGQTKPIASFTSSSSFCQNINYTFTNTSPVNYAFQWLYDGSVISSAYHLNITMADSGSHNIQLIAYNGSTYDTVTQSLFVNPQHFIQPLSIQADTVCPGSNAVISVYNSLGYLQYTLRNGFSTIGSPQFGNGGTITFTIANFQKTTTYNISVTGSNACFTDSLITNFSQVAFPDKYLPVIIGDTLICSGYEFYQIAIQNTQPGVVYKLRNGGTELDTASGTGNTITLSTPVLYKAFGSNLTYNLQAYVNASCSSLMQYLNVHVDSTYSKFNVTTPNVFPGDSISFLNLSYAGNYSWTFPPQSNIQSSTLASPKIAINTPGAYSIKLRTTNPEGCEDSSSAKVFVMALATSGTTNFCGNTSVLPNSLTPYDSYLDKEKNLYLTGSYSGVWAQSWTFFAIKLDSLGNLKWYKTAKNNGFEQSSGQGIDVDQSGNVYVTGFFRGSKIAFGALEFNAGSVQNQKGFLIKYDSNGNEQWLIKGSRQTNTGFGMWFSDLAIDTLNRVYFTGEHENGVFTFPDNSTFTATGDSTGAFLMSIDTSGLNFSYSTFGVKSGGRTTGAFISFMTNPRIELLPNQDLLISSCYSDSSNNMQTQFGSYSFTDTSNTIYAGIYNPISGWKNVLRGPSGNIWFMKKAVADANFNIYVTGMGSRNLEFKNSFYSLDPFFNGGTANYLNNTYLAKIDSNGTSGWLNYSKFNRITDITVNSNNQLMFAAFVDSNGFFSNQNGIPKAIVTKGKYDYVIGKYNTNGNLLFANSGETKKDDAAFTLTLDKCDNIMLATSINRTQGSNFPDPSPDFAGGNFAIQYFSKDNSCYHDATCNTVIIDTLNDDAAILQTWLNKSLTAFGSIPVSAKLKSLGVDSLFNAEIIVEVNGVQQISYNWSGALGKYRTQDSVALGSLNFAVPGTFAIKTYVRLPNGNTDLNHQNDTSYTTINVCAPLAGTYTIGSGGDFSSFTEATTHLSECGIGGHVYFDIFPGVYTDRILLKNIPTSVTDSVVFRSSNHDSTSVVLQWGGGYPYTNGIVELDNASYVTLYQITILNLDIDQSVNMNIHLSNVCSNFNLMNCIIKRLNPDTITDGILLNGGSSADSALYICYNLFSNGGNAISFYNNAAGVTTIAHNNFLNQTETGINVQSQGHINITDNTIETDFHRENAFYSLAVQGTMNTFVVSRNKITVFNGGAIGIGTNAVCSPSTPGLICNNMISIVNTIENTNGFQLSGNAAHVNFYNNSIFIGGTSNISSGIYLSGGPCTGIDIKNNIITMADSGYVLWWDKFKDNTIDLDYNCYSTKGIFFARNDTLGPFYSSSYNTLGLWSVFSGTDVHSVFHETQFISGTDLHILNDSVVENKAIPLLNVTDDFDQDARSLTTPDMGCDEFTGNPNLVNVFPGDANNNKTVDNYDIIPLGFYFNTTGNARATVSNVFLPQQALKWGANQFNGEDKVYADCDGSGTINTIDTVAVKLNYGQTHLLMNSNQQKKPYEVVSSSSGPDLYFITNDSVFVPGDSVSIELWTGTASQPVSGLMAIGFQMNLDPLLIESGTLSCDISDNWMCGLANCISFSNVNQSTGNVDGTVVKNDSISVNGFGKIATIRFVVNSSLTAITNLNLNLLNYFAADSSGDSILFNIIPDSVLVSNGAGVMELNSEELFIYPNPVSEILTIYFNASLRPVSVRNYDLTGRLVSSQHLSSTVTQIEIPVEHLVKGCYILEILTSEKVMRRRIVKE